MDARSKWSLIIAQLGGREDLHWQSPTSIDWRRGCLGNGANQRVRLMNVNVCLRVKLWYTTFLHGDIHTHAHVTPLGDF